MGNRLNTRNKPFIVGLGGLQWGLGGALTKGVQTATAVLDFPSVAAASTSDLTIAVPGAVVGDNVQLGIPAAAAAAGLIFMAYVSAAGVVTVRAANITAGAIDPAAGTYRVTVPQY